MWHKVLGHFVYGISWLLHRSLKIQIKADEDYSLSRPYLFCFWHGKQFLPVMQLKEHLTPKAVLVSASSDGDILSTCLQHMDYAIIRGSSRRKNVAAVKGMIRKLKEGYSLGFGIDGPTGPIYKVKPGMAFLAQKFNIDLIPVGTAFQKKWIFTKAWDKFELPVPFSRCTFLLGKPFKISANLPEPEASLLIEQHIKAAELQAYITLL